MCGRYVISSSPEALRRLFGYAEQPNYPARYNVAPTQPVPVVINGHINGHGGRHFRLMRWGLLPAWVKDPRKFALVINARSDTVQDKPAFRNALQRRRCLLPADGYYEWQDAGDRKRPFFIHRRDHAPIAFAGLAETWTGPNGEELDTVAIVTTAAAGEMAQLHHRVPVTIEPADFDRWLDCRAFDATAALALLVAPKAGLFTWHEVSNAVNRVANDSEQLILPISAEEATREELSAVAKKRASSSRSKSADNDQGSLF
jgi:putative SOS response-associated peptidase YedK